MKKTIVSQSVTKTPIKKPLLLIGNPTAQSGKAAVRIEHACEIMHKLGINYEFKPTLPHGKTVDLVEKTLKTDRFNTVVYMGGDGTFNEVAKGILASGKSHQISLGMLPFGTANDQGKSFGISSLPKALEKNIKTILAGYTEYLDIGKVTAFSDTGIPVTTDIFFDSLGWGLSAAILAFRNKEIKLVEKMPLLREMYRDHAVYLRATIHELTLNWLTRDRFTAEVEVDGKIYILDKLSDLVINNTILYAGEWIMSKNALHNDGKFEVEPFFGIRDWTSKLIIHHKKNKLTEKMLNQVGVSHTKNLCGKKIKIQILRPAKDKRLPSQLDGDEFVQSDHFQIEVMQKLLKIIVPQDFHWI